MRVAVDGSGNWSATSFFVPFREGFITLEPDGSETEFDITFAKAFTSGNAPVVDFSLQIPDGETEPTLLSAMLKGDTTLTGFTLLFSAPLTHNVRVNYMARQLNGTHGGGAPALVFNSPTFTGTPTAPTAHIAPNIQSAVDQQSPPPACLVYSGGRSHYDRRHQSQKNY
jgi:hypothetical protein